MSARKTDTKCLKVMEKQLENISRNFYKELYSYSSI